MDIDILEESMSCYAPANTDFSAISSLRMSLSASASSVYNVVNNFCQSSCFLSQAEESSEPSNQAQNGEKTPAINEENIAKAAASALAAAAVKAKVREIKERSGLLSLLHGAVE